MTNEEVITHLKFIKEGLMPNSPSYQAIEIAISAIEDKITEQVLDNDRW